MRTSRRQRRAPRGIEHHATTLLARAQHLHKRSRRRRGHDAKRKRHVHDAARVRPRREPQRQVERCFRRAHGHREHRAHRLIHQTRELQPHEDCVARVRLTAEPRRVAERERLDVEAHVVALRDERVLHPRPSPHEARRQLAARGAQQRQVHRAARHGTAAHRACRQCERQPSTRSGSTHGADHSGAQRTRANTTRANRRRSPSSRTNVDASLSLSYGPRNLGNSTRRLHRE